MKEDMTIICHRIACQFNRYCGILESKVDWVPGNYNRILLIPIGHSLSSNAGLEPVDVNYKQNRHVYYFIESNTYSNWFPKKSKILLDGPLIGSAQ